MIQKDASLITVTTETLAYVQNKDVLNALTFRVLLKSEPPMDHLKKIHIVLLKRVSEQ